MGMSELYEAFYENMAVVSLAAVCLLVVGYLGLRQLSNWWAGLRFHRRKRRSTHSRRSAPGRHHDDRSR
jgi:hypothetical protein